MAAEDLVIPVRGGVAIVPHDTNPLSFVTRSIWVGVAGNITGRLVDDVADVTIPNVPVGMHSFMFSHIRATGTTAASMLALR
jgi:hypothetical protein